MVLLDKVKRDIPDLSVKPQIFIAWQLFSFEQRPRHIGGHSLFGKVSKCI